jgi:hypothetical protein
MQAMARGIGNALAYFGHETGWSGTQMIAILFSSAHLQILAKL